MLGFLSILLYVSNWQISNYRRLQSNPNADIYNIDIVDQHPKTVDTALKHCETYSRYAAKSICAVHTSIAFKEAADFVDRFYQSRGIEEKGAKYVILDSGCGRGKSTLCLATLYPNIPVIGIDRSISRLTSNKKIEVRTSVKPVSTSADSTSVSASISELSEESVQMQSVHSNVNVGKCSAVKCF